MPYALDMLLTFCRIHHSNVLVHCGPCTISAPYWFQPVWCSIGYIVTNSLIKDQNCKQNIIHHKTMYYWNNFVLLYHKVYFTLCC